MPHYKVFGAYDKCGGQFKKGQNLVIIIIILFSRIEFLSQSPNEKINWGDKSSLKCAVLQLKICDFLYVGSINK